MSMPSKALDEHIAGNSNGAPEAPNAGQWSTKPAPWHVRNSRLLMAGGLAAGICGFAALGFVGWRALGPSPLDEIKVIGPAGEPTTVERAPRLSAPRGIDPPGASPPTANRSRGNEGTARNRLANDGSAAVSSNVRPPQGVTHTRSPDQTSAAVAPTPSAGQTLVESVPTVQGNCAEGVAALGLCTPQSRELDK
jgi:hypothetical protein